MEVILIWSRQQVISEWEAETNDLQVECEAGGLGSLGRMIKWSKIGGDIPDGIVADRGTLR